MPVHAARVVRFPLRASHLVALAMLFAVAAPATAGLTVTPVGMPAWKLVDFHLFAAPIGDAPNFPDYQPTALGVLPNHAAHAQLFVGPGPAHAPPYDSEFAAGVAAKGYKQTDAFTSSDFSGPSAVWLAFMAVPGPGAATGSSPDFASGPIIPNSLFPIDVTVANIKGGTAFSGTSANQIPALNDPALTPSFDVDGHSHFPEFLVDNVGFATDPSAEAAGTYDYTLHLRDTTGAGYDVSKTFTVSAVPLPAAAWTGLMCLGGLGVVGVVRRRFANQ